jgi:hypothetical protein
VKRLAAAVLALLFPAMAGAETPRFVPMAWKQSPSWILAQVVQRGLGGGGGVSLGGNNTWSGTNLFPTLDIGSTGTTLSECAGAGTLCIEGVALGSGTIGGTLTATRVPFASGASTLTDAAGFTFISGTGTLTAPLIVGSTSIQDSGLTATHVVFAGASGLLSGDADCTFTGGDTLTCTKIGAATMTGLLSAATSIDLGSTTAPFRNLYIYGAGTFGTTSIKLAGTPTGARTVTFPDSNTTVPIISQQLTIAGPTAARTYTLPDGSVTLVDTTSAQTLTGPKSLTSPLITNLTAGRVTFAGASGLLTDDASMTFSTGNLFLTQAASVDLHLTSSNNNAAAFVEFTNDQADEIVIATPGSAYAGTTMGTNRADTAEILAAGTFTNGMKVFTDGASPLIFGTNNVARMQFGTGGILSLQGTITAAGTTGAQTISKMSGTVNFAAAAATVVVTNTLASTSSNILAIARTNDATCQVKDVEPAAGSFTIRMTANCTAETSVGWFIFNPNL